MSGAAVPDDYHLKFQRVIWLFRHQRVFCPKEEKLVHLRPLPNGGNSLIVVSFVDLHFIMIHVGIGAADVDVPAAIPEPGDTLDFLGPVYSDEIAVQVSKGKLQYSLPLTDSIVLNYQDSFVPRLKNHLMRNKMLMRMRVVRSFNVSDQEANRFV